jgi:hypothetical protein
MDHDGCHQLNRVSKPHLEVHVPPLGGTPAVLAPHNLLAAIPPPLLPCTLASGPDPSFECIPLAGLMATSDATGDGAVGSGRMKRLRGFSRGLNIQLPAFAICEGVPPPPPPPPPLALAGLAPE